MLFIVSAFCTLPKYFPKSSSSPAGSVPYTVKFFKQKVSHYNYRHSNRTFDQKYLIDDSHFSKENGCILFYCGNEGPIEMFYKNTMFYNNKIKEELNALLVYPEHRYFGVSMPFGDQKTSYSK